MQYRCSTTTKTKIKFIEFPTICDLDNSYNIKQMGTSCVIQLAGTVQ